MDGSAELPSQKGRGFPKAKATIDNSIKSPDVPINGVWYSSDKNLKARFYSDDQFEFRIFERPGLTKARMWGTYRKDDTGHYWLRPAHEGSMAAQPGDTPEVEYVLEGNRLCNANDHSLVLYKFE
jgi:hypothetical protein